MDDMPDEAIEAPAGVEPDQDKPTPDNGPEPDLRVEPDKPDAGDEEPSFYDSPPSELPDELQPTYKSMQAAFTRKNMELARQRKEAEQAQAVYDALLDPERAPEVLAALGYPVEADDEGFAGEGEYDPGIEDVRAEIADIRGTLAQQAEQDFLIREIAEIEGQINRQLDGDEMNLVAQLALDNPMPDGTPDVKTAWATLQNIIAAEQKRWISGKRNHPRPPGSGVSEVTERIDRSDPEARRKLLEQAVQRELESAS